MAFKKVEKGNECEKAWVKLKYRKEMVINEYLNIFKIVRKPFIYEFINYFRSIEEKFGTQSSDTKIDINEYLNEIENINQEIVIVMTFKILCKNQKIYQI